MAAYPRLCRWFGHKTVTQTLDGAEISPGGFYLTVEKEVRCQRVGCCFRKRFKRTGFL